MKTRKKMKAFVLATALSVGGVWLFTGGVLRAQENEGEGGVERGAFFVVNSRAVVANSAAGRALGAQLQAKRVELENAVKAVERKVTEERDRLLADRGLVSEEELKARTGELEGKIVSAREALTERQRVMSVRQQEGVKKIEGVLGEVLQDLARERSAWVILDARGVALYRPQLDVTAEVLKRVDAKLPELTLDFTSAPGRK